MQSLNFEGQILIETAEVSRIINRKKSLDLIEQSISDIATGNIKCVKEKIMNAYKLTLQSTHDAFIAVKGGILLMLYK